MMIVRQDDILHVNALTSEELLNKVEVSFMSYCDVYQLAELMTKCFGVSTECFAVEQLIMSRALINNSVKVFDPETDEIYGFLILSRFNLDDGSPIKQIESSLCEFLSQFSQIHGFAFVLDKRLRNQGIDKQMIEMTKPFIESFDFVWLAVDSDLRSDAYWRRMGFRVLFSLPDATFYGRFNKNIKNADIYYKFIFFNSEDHSIERGTGEDADQSYGD